MTETLTKILTNNICAGVLTDSKGKWFGSTLIKKEDIEKDVQEVFDFTFKIKELYNKLTTSGYIAKYSFWNPIDNKVKN